LFEPLARDPSRMTLGTAGGCGVVGIWCNATADQSDA
jgi:hypothetical protein